MQVTGACIWAWNRILSTVDDAHVRDQCMKMLRGEPVMVPEHVKITPTFFTLGKCFTAMRKEVGWLRVCRSQPFDRSSSTRRMRGRSSSSVKVDIPITSRSIGHGR